MNKKILAEHLPQVTALKILFAKLKSYLLFATVWKIFKCRRVNSTKIILFYLNQVDY